MTFADTVGTLLLETPQIDDIGTASIQLVDGETGTVLTTAPLYRCSNRLLATVSFPNTTVQYVVVGNDINGRRFTTPLYRSATFAPEDAEIIQDTLVQDLNNSVNYEAIFETFRVEMEGDTSIEEDQIIIVVRVYNMNVYYSHYTFTAEPVTGFRQAFRPISLQVPPEESGSVNMIILRETAEPGSNYTFTATVSDGYSSHSLSKTVLILLPVSKKLGYYLK